MDDEGNEPFGTLTAPERGLEREEARDEILGAIDRLTEQERTAVTLYYREDLRLGERFMIALIS